MCCEDGAFTRCVVHICFAEFASVFAPSLICTSVLTMDEFEILAPILLIIMAGANILFLDIIVPLGDILSLSKKHWIHSIYCFHYGGAL